MAHPQNAVFCQSKNSLSNVGKLEEKNEWSLFLLWVLKTCNDLQTVAGVSAQKTDQS
jgi:hypothetical protein